MDDITLNQQIEFLRMVVFPSFTEHPNDQDERKVWIRERVQNRYSNIFGSIIDELLILFGHLQTLQAAIDERNSILQQQTNEIEQQKLNLGSSMTTTVVSPLTQKVSSSSSLSVLHHLPSLSTPEEFFTHLPNIGERRPTPEEAFGELSSFTCRGRETQLNEILTRIRRTKLGQRSKRTAYYFHASPGVGKTYLLSQLYRMNFPPGWDELKNDVFFLVADFNRGCCVEALPFKEDVLKDSELFVLLRIYYVEFIDRLRMNWKDFLEKFFRQISSTNDAKFYMKNQIKAKADGKIIVLLVDEIMKIKIIQKDENKFEFAERCRSSLCRFMDSLDLCHYVFFSSLSKEFMKKESDPEGSGRGVVAICTLPLLSHTDTLELLKENISHCEFSTCETRNVAVNPELQERCFETLATLCSGHGRSIEQIVDYCPSNGSINFESLIQQATQSLVNMENQSDLYLIFESILLGEPVRLLEYIGQETYTSLVAKGLLIDSFSDDCPDKFIPSSPGVFLYVWSNSFMNVQQKLCQNLKDMLLLRVNFHNSNFEKFHSHWEMMIRYVRPEGFKKKPLREVYRITEEHNPNYNSSLMSCPIDAQSKLEPVKYPPNSILHAEFNKIIIPDDANQSGWDRLIFYECFPSGNTPHRYILPIFIQSKFSKRDSKTCLSISTVENAVSNCRQFLTKFCSFNDNLIPRKKRHFHGDPSYQFVVIFVARQKFNQNTIIQPPSNVLFCFEEELQRLYGPTLYQIVNDLVPGESLVVNSIPIIPEIIEEVEGGDSEEKIDYEVEDIKKRFEETKMFRTK